MFRRLSASVILGMCASACATPPVPFSLHFTVLPTNQGVDVIVEVHGGRDDLAWVGFAAGPAASPELPRRIHSVQAWTLDGRRLPQQQLGEAGYQIDLEGSSWQLGYSLNLRTHLSDDIFYRSSVRDDDFLVLVGSDAWARFYSNSDALALRPNRRPSGTVLEARVTFNLAKQSIPWRVATTAWARSPLTYELSEHPTASVFALGPFEIRNVDNVDGLRLAVHTRWSLLNESIDTLTGKLLLSHRKRLGTPRSTTALAMMSPLPQPLRPVVGLRTAGMVRGRSLILYAGDGHRTNPNNLQLQEAMAVFLGHELFHLWVPSSVQVTRELSWLSEGWAMHMGRLAAVDVGWLSEPASMNRLQDAYRRYLKIGGYRAGSLPEASMGSESRRDLLYLRGELVFRLLEQQWALTNTGNFEAELWRVLADAYDGRTPLEAESVRLALASLVDHGTVQRYVEGTSPLTPSALGLRHR